MDKARSLRSAALVAILAVGCGGSTTTGSATTDSTAGAGGASGSTATTGSTGGPGGASVSTTGSTSTGSAGGASGSTTTGSPSTGSTGGAAGTGGSTGGTGGAKDGGAAGRDAATPDGQVGNQLEIYSWLVSGTEKTALDALFDEVRKRVPGASIVNAAQNRVDEARRELPMRIASQVPPDSFQALPGFDLGEWTSKGALESLDALSAEQAWPAAIPKPVLDLAGRAGTLYAAPLQIARDNTLFYNKAILATYSLSAPSTPSEFLTAAAMLKTKGITALAVSASGGWTIASNLFDAVLLAEAGPDFHQAYLAGQKTGDAKEVATALTDLGVMMDYANLDRATTFWSGAVGKVCRGEAAMILLPDFVKQEFLSQGCGPDKIGYVPFQPAGTPSFVFVTLGFTLPKGAPHHDVALEFLRVVGSAAGQSSFNSIRGTIPARTDVAVNGFDAISVQTMKDFAAQSERIVPSSAVAASAIFQESVNPALQAFVDPSNAAYKNVATVLQTLRQNYASIVP